MNNNTMERIKKIIAKDIHENFRDLCQLHGVSGYEKNIAEYIRSNINEYVDDIHEDNMGNLICRKNSLSSSKKQNVMLVSHMDEIGLIIKYIDKKGFIFFDKIGGVRKQDLFSKPVLIKTDAGIKKGLINCTKPGRPEGVDQIPELDQFFVDVGADSKKDVLKMGIDIGDTIVNDNSLIFIGKDKLASRALDDKLSIFVLFEVIKLITTLQLEVPDITLAFTSQEEVGCRGARAAAYNIDPEFALVYDVTVANDIPDVKERNIISKLNNGVAIKVADRIGGLFGLITNPEIRKNLAKIAEKNSIKYQLEIFPAGTTDGAEIQNQRGGIPTGVLDIPTRYVHAYEMAAINDIIATVLLTIVFLQDFKYQ